jgi:UDP-glucose 4-epimerase
MNGQRYVALRYFNVYGPRMDTHGKYTEVLIRWMECIDSGVRPTIFGNGFQTMDFVHVRDVARANVLAAKANVSDMVFNIGSGMETSLVDLAGLLLRIMGRDDLKPHFGIERKVNSVSRRLASTDAARRLLGFETSVPLEEGLAHLVEWWRREGRLSETREPVAYRA